MLNGGSPVRVCFVVNPASAHGRTRNAWTRLEPQVARLGEYAVRFTEGPGHATELARQAVAEGFDRVAAMGGDGTLNEVGNGLVGTGVPLAMIPSGTGNDYVRTIGVPLSPERAVDLAFRGAARPADAAQLEGGRHFFNIAGIGFDAQVAYNQHRFRLLKAIPGTFSSVAAVFITLAGWHNARMQITLDDQVLERNVLLVAIGMGRYYGGGMQIMPDSVLDDGLLEVVIGGDVTRTEIFGLLPKLYSGAHKTHPKVDFLRGRRIAVDSTAPLVFQMDGDVSGKLPVAFSIRPGALQIVAGPEPGPGVWSSETAP